MFAILEIRFEVYNNGVEYDVKDTAALFMARVPNGKRRLMNSKSEALIKQCYQ